MSVIASIIFTIILPSLVFGGDCPPERLDPERSLEAKLHSDLFCAYDRNLKPVRNRSEFVNEFLGIEVKHFIFDEAKDTLSVYATVYMGWRDEFLTWNPKDYGDINRLRVNSLDIWHPELFFMYDDCTVESDGIVSCEPYNTFTAVCVSKVANWPYDTQNCTLEIGTWDQDEHLELNSSLVHMVFITGHTEGSGWKLRDAGSFQHPGRECCPKTEPSLRFYFEIKRIEGGHAAVIVIPSIVLALLTLTSLLLAAKNPGRLTLACFSLFGHFLFLTEITSHLPRASEDTPLILLFLRDSMLVTIAVIVITICLSCVTSKVRTPPVWIASSFKIFESGIGNYFVFTEFNPISSNSDDLEYLSSEPKRNSADEWTLICNVINSILFIIFLVIYIILLFTDMPRATSDMIQ